jgi:hypothetical protein
MHIGHWLWVPGYRNSVNGSQYKRKTPGPFLLIQPQELLNLLMLLIFCGQEIIVLGLADYNPHGFALLDTFKVH